MESFVVKSFWEISSSRHTDTIMKEKSDMHELLNIALVLYLLKSSTYDINGLGQINVEGITLQQNLYSLH